MPQVAVQINGRTYRMQCDEGQEAHLMQLASRFDRSIESLKGSFGEIGDQRLTVMAGVMVTDEVVELTQRVRGLEAELSQMRGDSGRDEDREAKLATAIDRTAQRIETMAARLAPSSAATSSPAASNGAATKKA